MDISDILKKINDSLKEQSAFGGKVYKDEAIIRPASSLGSYVPAEIKELISFMNTREFLMMSRAKQFVTAGKKMADFTDNCEKIAPFFCYFSTYSVMDKHQLRTYFTWRTRVRKGDIYEVPYSYVFVYIYELINLIGVENASEGFEKLRDFMDKYVLIEPKLAYYRSQWLSDYIVYYGLPAEYLKGTYNNENEEALYCLINCKEMSDEELFPAISRLSSYNIEASAFYKEYADDCRQAVCRVYRAWAEYYSKHRKYSLDWHLFGVSVKRVITLFQNAVFFDTRESPDGVFEFSKLCRYQCENGIWTLENYPTGIRKNADLGAVVKETDLIMRREYGYKKQLKETFDNKTVIKIITKEVTGLIEEKRKNAVPEVVIDLSSLDRIRRDADITRDKLLTEEEILPETETAVTPAEDIPEESGLLEKKEREFLSLILSGGDVKAFALKEGVMISMLCESINEKLYDSFGDIVIDFADDVPMIIDDYIEEIKELL